MSSNRSTAASTHHQTSLPNMRRIALRSVFAAILPRHRLVAPPGCYRLPLLKQNPRRPAMPQRYVCPPQFCPRIPHFGSTMIAEPTKPQNKPKEIRVFRRLVPLMGLVAVWGIVVAAAPAQAQVNIDQGKSTAEIFSGDCGTCHKTPKGLANGRNS